MGLMLRAMACTVEPEAMMMLSSRVMSCAAARPMARFSSTASCSFSITERLWM